VSRTPAGFVSGKPVWALRDLEINSAFGTPEIPADISTLPKWNSLRIPPIVTVHSAHRDRLIRRIMTDSSIAS
jgi:hypothetical protein